MEESLLLVLHGMEAKKECEFIIHKRRRKKGSGSRLQSPL
jgi:hypothetical protein